MSSIETAVPPQGTSAAGRLRRGTLLTEGAVLTLGAAAIHLAGTPARLAESPLLGAGIAALGLAQLVLVVALVFRPAGRVVLAGAVINAGAMVLWAVGHTIGLSVGLTLWRPEPLSVTDLVLPALEVGAALLFGLAVRSASRPRAPRGWLMTLTLLPVVLLTTILTVPGAIAAPDDTWLPIGGTVKPRAGGTTTLTYCSPGGIPRGMDVTEPAAAAARPAPAVLYVHGGGWFEGDRQPSSMGARFAGQHGALFVPLRDELSRRGFVVASIDYGLIPLYPWPDQIEDAKCYNAVDDAVSLLSLTVGGWVDPRQPRR